MFAAEQVAALKYLIFNAKDVDELAKRVLAFLIDHSEGLQTEVCLTLTDSKEGYGADEIQGAADSCSAMQSSCETTHLNELMTLMGCDLSFCLHYGDFDPQRTPDAFCADGQFEGARLDQVTDPGAIRTGLQLRYTFWLCRKDYSRQAKFLPVIRQQLEQIDTRRSGLYSDA